MTTPTLTKLHAARAAAYAAWREQPENDDRRIDFEDANARWHIAQERAYRIAAYVAYEE